jgi:hypothetical protein
VDVAAVVAKHGDAKVAMERTNEARVGVSTFEEQRYRRPGESQLVARPLRICDERTICVVASFQLAGKIFPLLGLRRRIRGVTAGCA